jgi:hypothetical protein
VNRSSLDHIVITAPSLAAGVEHVRRALGIAPITGGEHSRMGTHNALLRLGGASYLEVIAANPAASRPAHPRWFELDRLAPDGAPRLAAWVARSSDLRTIAVASPIPLGTVEAATRGDLAWNITLPAGGALVERGVVPMVIEWTSGSHPAGRLPDVGLSLEMLELAHPRPDAIESVLKWMGFEGPVNVERGDVPSLSARVRTPEGMRTLA